MRVIDIISKIFGGFNIKASYRSLNNDVGEITIKDSQVGDKVDIAYGDNNGGFTINYFLLYGEHNKSYKKLIREYSNDLLKNEAAKGINLNDILSSPSNYEAFYNVVQQLYVGQKDSVEKRHLLSTLLLQKFKSKEEDVDIYLQAIQIVKNLTIRDLNILSIIAFFTFLSRILSKETIQINSNIIDNILKEVKYADIEEIRYLENLGILCSLFPYMYDDTDFIELNQFAPELYDCFQSFLTDHSFISGFKVTFLGRVVIKAFMLTCYNISYEETTCLKVPIKKADLNVGNVIATGDIAAYGEVSSGGIDNE